MGQPGWGSLDGTDLGGSVWVRQPECDMQPVSDSLSVTCSLGQTARVGARVEQPGDKVSLK